MSAYLAEVLNLYAAYCHSVDDGQAADLEACFTEEAVFRVIDRGAEGTATSRELVGRSGIVSGILGVAATRAGFRHLAFNHRLTQSGESVVEGVADFQVFDGDGCIEATGRYLDTFVASDAGWKISTRVVEYGWRRGWR